MCNEECLKENENEEKERTPNRLTLTPNPNRLTRTPIVIRPGARLTSPFPVVPRGISVASVASRPTSDFETYVSACQHEVASFFLCLSLAPSFQLLQ